MQPPTMPQALKGGSLDGYAIWEPWGSLAEEELKDNFITLAAPEIYRYHALFSGSVTAIKDRPLVIKILKALIKAEEFIKNNDAEAFTILSKSITFDENSFKRLWPKYIHKVVLQDSTIKLMTDNFELLREDDVNFKDIKTPNFREFIDESFLKEIDPKRIMLQ